MTIFTRDGLIDLLRHNVVTVTFTKVNGEERIMDCTLQANLIPNAPTQNGQLIVEGKNTSNNISVWDVKANGWRSFRIANVKNVSVG
jgi:hypothetical protein